MPAVFTCLRVALRARIRAIALLVLVAGLFAGAVIAAAAGARRTDSAYPRLLRATNAPDVIAFSTAQPDQRAGFARFSADQLTRLPEVAQSGQLAFFSVVRPAQAQLLAPADEQIPDVIFGRKMITGRGPRPDRADEVSISFVLADALHLHVGDRLPLDLAAATGAGPPVRHESFRVVGVDAAAGEFPPQPGLGTDLVWASPAFYRANASTMVAYLGTAMRLHRGRSDVPNVQAAISRLGAGKPTITWALADQAVNTERSIHLQAVALWLLAALLGVTAALVLAQIIARQAFLDADDHPALRALGMTRAQLFAVTALRAAVIAIPVAAAAAVTAYLVSPLLPVGLARDAEPHPGFAFDASAILLGALATALIVGAAASIPAWRAASLAGRRARTTVDAEPSGIANALRRSAAPVTVATGVRMALEPGRGRTSVPVRTTVAGAVLAIAALATALVFGSSLDHLLATPNLYGVTWDARLSSLTSNDVSRSLPVLATDRRVEDVAVGFTGFPVDVGSTRLEGLAIRATKGDLLMPVPTQGRAPEQPDELMLGTRTIKDLHTRVGGTLTASLGGTGKTQTFRVVGVGVFPPLDDSLTLGKGVATTVDAVISALPAGSPAPTYDSAFIRFAPGVDRPAALADLNAAVATAAETVTVPEKPVDLINFGRVQQLPLVLSALLGALAAATLAHLLATSVRRRRRDLALLKTLGFVPRQVRWTVAWQASTLAVAALVVGVPLGIVAGRFVWTAFGHQLGILPAPSIGVVRLAALVVGTVVVANLVALLPGRVAAHTRPAEILRSE